ncbi:hypothetical protein DY000_02022674 [Brassica cretica]|uniref:Uncharacterized protein n=1 Tax=Brassica cretica TaxID=69181 RepID=A0ABQ7E0C3_BRACR|nr:hypothetical protein DY000_02022674 [Brassica cretica]
MFLSASPVRQTGVPASVTQPSNREFVGITVLFLDEKVNSVIHGFTPVGRANHYMPSLKACSIVKVDRLRLLASVMDSSLPEIALTMVFRKKKILLLNKDRDNPVNSPFQAEQ